MTGTVADVLQGKSDSGVKVVSSSYTPLSGRMYAITRAKFDVDTFPGKICAAQSQ